MTGFFVVEDLIEDFIEIQRFDASYNSNLIYLSRRVILIGMMYGGDCLNCVKLFKAMLTLFVSIYEWR